MANSDFSILPLNLTLILQFTKAILFNCITPYDIRDQLNSEMFSKYVENGNVYLDLATRIRLKQGKGVTLWRHELNSHVVLNLVCKSTVSL